MARKLITKDELQNELQVTRPTLLNIIKQLIEEEDCPFNWHQWLKMGKYIKSKWYYYISENV